MYGMYPMAAEGSRHDYLLGAVMWHVATPEELKEWQALERPHFIKRWEERLGYLKSRALGRVESLRLDAADWRRGKRDKNIQYCLERANRCEQYALDIEQKLNSNTAPDTYNLDYYYGLLNEQRD
jgi:hypothetical protein